MGTAGEQLTNATREELIEAFLAAVQSVQQKDEKIEQLQHQLDQLQKMIFGARSEKSRTLYPDHPTLFDVEPSEAEPEVETEEVVQKRKKSAATKSILRWSGKTGHKLGCLKLKTISIARRRHSALKLLVVPEFKESFLTSGLAA